MKPFPASKKKPRKIGFLLFIALAAMILFYSAIALAATVLFQDNFESGNASSWQLDPGWLVVNDSGNFVLSGSNHSFARTGDQNWSNYSFKAKVKLKDSGSAVHLNYRCVCERYFIGLNSGALYLSKTKPCGTHPSIVHIPESHSAGRWYALEIIGRQGNIKVYLDGNLKIDYTDNDPVLRGPISFETLSGSVYFDEVIVTTDEPHSRRRWESTTGPLGGLGYDVRIHPAEKLKMYVTDNFAGIVKSDTGGLVWYQANNGITTKSGATGDAHNIFSLTIDPNNPDIVWAGTFGDGSAFGVFKSTDGAQSWSLKTNGISLEGDRGLVFRGFTILPGNSNRVYAQAEVTTSIQGREFNLVKGRVYKTEDGGGSWTKIWEGDNLARYLIVHPYNSNILYLSTGIFDREANNSNCKMGIPGGVGILKTTDGGLTWFPVNNGLTDLYVGSLRMHPNNPEILFAATGNNACSGAYDGNVTSGLFRTANGGASWEKVIANNIMGTVNFSVSNSNVVYAGSAAAFYRSGDGGLGWTQLFKEGSMGYGPQGIKAGFPIDVVVDPDDPYVLYANNYGGGVFRSIDGAETWVDWSKGYTGSEIHRVHIPRDQPETVHAIGRSGPFTSSGFGINWKGICNGDAVFMGEWYDIASQPGNAATILITDEHQGGILRSANGGERFDEVFRHPLANASDPEKRQGFKSIAFSPANPIVVYAGMAKSRLISASSAPFGTVIYKSTDAGRSFSPRPSILDGSNVHRIIISPINSNVAYAATSTGVYRTVDGADSWVKLDSMGFRDIQALAVDFGQTDHIIAGEAFVGVFVSRDGGSTWTGPHNAGFSSSNPVLTALSFDTRNSNTLFAGDLYSGVYRSTDKGHTWVPFPDWNMSGLTFRAVKDIVLNEKVIYVATQGGGVFRYLRPETKGNSIAPLLPLILND